MPQHERVEDRLYAGLTAAERAQLHDLLRRVQANAGGGCSPGRVRALLPQGEEVAMQPTHVFADLTVPDIAEARTFYQDYLGLSEEQIAMDWVTRFQSPDGIAVVQLVTRDATAPCNAAVSVTVGDGVEEAYAEAQRRGYEIVHPLTTEPWGIRRFLVRSPDGNVININSHRDE